MKDMTSVATTMMSEEEKAELEKQLNGENTATSSGAPQSVTSEAAAGHPQTSDGTGRHTVPDTIHVSSPTSEHAGPPLVTPHGEEGTKSPTPSSVEREKLKEAARKKRQLNLEQKEKLRSQEIERRKRMEERIKALTEKLIERLRPFVEAKHPGEKDDSETIIFQEKIKREAEDLKLESFGVEVRVFSLLPWRYIPFIRTAASHNRQCVYDESYIFHEISQVLGHVRNTFTPSAARVSPNQL